MEDKIVILTSGTSWGAAGDWNNAANRVTGGKTGTTA